MWRTGECGICERVVVVEDGRDGSVMLVDIWEEDGWFGYNIGVGWVVGGVMVEDGWLGV